MSDNSTPVEAIGGSSLNRETETLAVVNMDGGDESEHELLEEQPEHVRPRKGGVCAEPYHKGYYFKMPFWNKFGSWELELFKALQKCRTFKQYSPEELVRFVQAMEIHKRFTGEYFGERGQVGDGLFVVLEGSVDLYDGDRRVSTHGVGSVHDEAQILFALPRTHSIRAQGEAICGKLRRLDFVNLGVRLEISKRDRRQYYLRTSKLLEMMTDEQICQLADVFTLRVYEPGQHIVKQGSAGGKEFYVLEKGEAVVSQQNGETAQEIVRYYGGELFGERALVQDAPRAANIIAVSRCEILVLDRAQFERLFGSMKDLQAQQYLTDPRKLIADFYGVSDCRGPKGSLVRAGQQVDTKQYGESTWFVVYRPTSNDAIAKMLSGNAVGKGLNVKGKSAKKGRLSGYVPFVQISDNKHKPMVEKSPAGARLKLFFKSTASRADAVNTLKTIASQMEPADANIQFVEDYAPEVFGVDMSECLLAQAYIQRPDLTPVMGWETGRQSEPALMDFNLHAVREPSEPKVVLYQFDEADPMNPRGLLVAYAEKRVKPVVSDFDTFTVGSQGMKYEPLPLDQAKLITWELDHTEQIMNTLNEKDWTARWFQVIKTEGEKGFHPKFPKYGYGDPTSYRLIGDVVDALSWNGAVRHGAECCNFYFPQELDDQYLVVWEKFQSTQGIPWAYVTEEGCRSFLLERAQEGYAFPVNFAWCIRDKGWFPILEALEASPSARDCLQSWYPPQVKLLERVHKIHKEHPEGFKIIDKIEKGAVGKEVAAVR